MDNKILNAALDYARKGWAVIPISRDKVPFIKWKEEDGVTAEYLKDPENIKSWWNKWPAANVAIATGKRSGGLVVIDIDISEDEGKYGNESLDDWCEKEGCFIDSNLTVRTGRGGKHLYFTSTEPFGNAVGCLPNIDIRGEGGLVVAPPSIHGKTRNSYEWEDCDYSDEISSVQEDPDVEYFLHEMFKTQKQKANKEKFEIPIVVEKGSRDVTLFKALCKLQQDGLTDEIIREVAYSYNAKFNPPLEDKVVEQKIKQALKYEKGKQNEDDIKTEERKEANVQNLQQLRSVNALLKENLPELKTIVGVGDEVPLLVEGTCILSAKSKIGKSWFSLELCDAVSKGNDFLGYKTNKCSTLYLDLETKKNLKQKRLRKLKSIVGELSDNYYIQDSANIIGEGFEEEIENYMKADPKIGVIVIDIFEKILKQKKKDISDYTHYYNNIGTLNKISEKYHVSIILVCHSKKIPDPTDPFADILGTTALQGATDQMIVMYKNKFNDPVTHIAAKGRTIDGLIEVPAQMCNGMWTKADNVAEVRDMEDMRRSPILDAVIALTESGKWEGRCYQFVEDSKSIGIDLGVPEDDLKVLGGIFNKKAFKKVLKLEHGIDITIKKNGTGSKIYAFTVDTVDDNGFTVAENDEIPY